MKKREPSYTVGGNVSHYGRQYEEVKSLSRVRLFVTPWTVAYQAPPSMGLSRPRVLEWGATAFSGIELHELFLCF